VRYGIKDDYGIADARFDYKVEAPRSLEEVAFKPSPLANAPAGTKSFPFEEKFQVLPLDLTVGVRLTLKVVAADADNLTGPHVTSGQAYAFQVVSDDELLALIAVKELNLRRRFEQILEEVKNTRKELLLSRTRLEEVRGKPVGPVDPAAAADGSDTRAPGPAVLSAIDRSITAVRKNHNETASIEEEFRDVRDELENNSVPDVKPMLERLDEGIIRPLHSVNTVDYNGLDKALVDLRQALEEGKAPLSHFQDPIDQINVTIEHLEGILAQMLKLETINEALQLLRDIIKSQEELQEKTRTERKKKLIEGLQ
jgi:hypothetical protein